MSEKDAAVLDKKAEFANWIIANDGKCSITEVCCDGGHGHFKGTRCPIRRNEPCCLSKKDKLAYLSKWLKNYHQQKAEAAEAEKRKAEAAKKEEQETKQEPARICGNCKHIHEVEKSGNMIAHCDMKKNMVPISFDRCPDFEPRATADQSGSSSSEGGVDAAAYAERITQLEKENARLAEEVSGYRGVTRRISEICEVIVIGIDQAIKEREELQNQLNLAKEDALRLGKENVDLSARCERLTEQRNRLSNSLIEVTRRVKEVERENAALYERISAMLSDLLYFQWKAETGQPMPFSVLNDIEERLKRIRQSWVSRLK
jgi:chromosome segregation ATPase